MELGISSPCTPWERLNTFKGDLKPKQRIKANSKSVFGETRCKSEQSNVGKLTLSALPF